MNKIELARDNIDVAIDKWLVANGVPKKFIYELDYSFLDDELNNLLDEYFKQFKQPVNG